MTTKIVKGKEFEKRVGQPVPPIKKHAADVVPAEGGGVIGHRVLASQERAERILTDAEEEANHILADANAIRADVEAARGRARTEGFAKGREEGMAELAEKMTQFAILKETFYRDAEPEIVKLALDIADKVIGQLANKSAEVVRTVVRQALERVIGDRITVRVHPEDYRTITADESPYRQVIDKTRRLIFKEDETISRGGCVVETEVGTIDARLETQLAAIRKALEI